MANNKKKKVKINPYFIVRDDGSFALGGDISQLSGSGADGDNISKGGLDPNITMLAGMAADLGTSAIDSFVTDEDDRITSKGVRKAGGKGALQGGKTGLQIGANPLLMGLTGGLSAPIGAALGAATGATVGTIKAKNAQEEIANSMKEMYYPEQFAMGGDITEINGPKHANGGVQIKQGVEVEGGEMKSGDYIFSDQLTPPGSKKTFAELAKKIKEDHEERPGDGPSERTKKAALDKLMQENEEARILKEQEEAEMAEIMQKDAMAYGGYIKRGKGGKIDIAPAHKNILKKVAKARKMNLNDYAEKILAYGGKMKEYADGGPLDPEEGTPSERVLKGSDRYKELMAMEEARKPYLAQQQYLSNIGYGDLTATDLSRITKSQANFDTSMIPEGSNIAYELPADAEDAAFKVSPDRGIQIFSDQISGKNYFTGIADPGEVPAYEVYEDTPTTETTSTTTEGYTLPPVRYEKQRAGAWYTTSDGKRVQAPEDAVWDEELGVYQDSAGNVYNPRGSSMTPGYNPVGGNRTVGDAEFALGGNIGDPFPSLDFLGSPTPSNNASDTVQNYKNQFVLDIVGENMKNLGSARDNTKDKETKTGLQNEELALLASDLPAIQNIFAGLTPEKTQLQRMKAEEVDLSKQRQLTERQAAMARATQRESIRGNARSSGQALAAMSSANAAINESVIQSHLNSLAQEETANAELRNRVAQMNTQIANQEITANEQNRAAAASSMNLAMSDMGQNLQAYLKDKKLTKENVRQNKRLMSIVNSFSNNYNWEDDDGELAIQFLKAIKNG